MSGRAITLAPSGGGGGGGGGTGAGSNLLFNYASNIAAQAGGPIRLAWECITNGSNIQVPKCKLAHQSGACWYTTLVNVSSFYTQFSFVIDSKMSSFVGLYPNETSINGMTFCIQNSNSTTNPSAYGTNATADANCSGYGCYSNQEPGDSIKNSVAVLFNCQCPSYYPFTSGHYASGVGLLINGGPQSNVNAAHDLNPYGINLNAGHTYTATVTYDGTVLTLVLLDTTTSNQARFAWNIDIPTIVGASTAYVGFTGGQYFQTAQSSAGATQELSAWTFYDGSVGTYSRLAAPTFSPAPGAYGGTQSVTLSGPVGASIYYTTNGLLPTTASTLYSGAISVTSTTVINAICVQSGHTDSYIVQGAYQIAASGKLINLPSGFSGASGLMICNGSSYISGSNVVLTDITTVSSPGSDKVAGCLQIGAAWYAAPVTVSAFSTTITLQFANNNSTANSCGLVFVLQNAQPFGYSYGSYQTATGGINTFSGNGLNGYGYGYPMKSGIIATGTTGGLNQSIGICFKLSNNTVGLWTNGDSPGDNTVPEISITGVTLHTGNTCTAAFTYSGTSLSMVLTDTVTTSTFSHTWTVDIPTTVGASTAYAGFTAISTNAIANQLIKAWTW